MLSRQPRTLTLARDPSYLYPVQVMSSKWREDFEKDLSRSPWLKALLRGVNNTLGTLGAVSSLAGGATRTTAAAAAAAASVSAAGESATEETKAARERMPPARMVLFQSMAPAHMLPPLCVISADEICCCSHGLT